MKRGLILFTVLMMLLFFPCKVKAESVSISLNPEVESVTVGESFIVRLTVSSNELFKRIEGFLSYDDEIIRYVSADDGITGGGGKLRVNIGELLEDEYVEEYEEDYGVSEENPEAEETKKTFQMVFKALKPGKTDFSFVDGMKVFSEKDEEMSLSIHVLSLLIKGKREASGVNTLSSLKVAEGDIFPEFSKNTFQYSLRVPFEVTRLVLSALPTDEKAGIMVAGNDNFQVGDNLVKLIVTAEDGNESIYELIVTREEEGKASDLEKESEKKEVIEEKKPSAVSDMKEKESKVEESIELSSNENKETDKGNRKKILFYGIMGVVGVIAFAVLKILLIKLKKMEEDNKKE